MALLGDILGAGTPALGFRNDAGQLINGGAGYNVAGGDMTGYGQQNTNPFAGYGAANVGTPQSWQNFKFQNPTAQWQQNFNSISDPTARMFYGFQQGQGGGGGESLLPYLSGAGIDDATIQQMRAAFGSAGAREPNFAALGLDQSKIGSSNDSYQQIGNKFYGITNAGTDANGNPIQRGYQQIADFGNPATMDDARFTANADFHPAGVDPRTSTNPWVQEHAYNTSGNTGQRIYSYNADGSPNYDAASAPAWEGSMQQYASLNNGSAEGWQGNHYPGTAPSPGDPGYVGPWGAQPAAPAAPAAPAPSQQPPPGAYIPPNENQFKPIVGANGDSMIGMNGNGGPITQNTTPNGLGAANQTANDYNYDPSKYLDPSMGWTMQQGLRGLGSTASAKGQTFSGQTLKDILGYSQGLASQNWNQAAQQAAQQQGFARGVDTSNVGMNQAQQGITNNLNLQNNAQNMQQQGINNALNQYNQGFQYQRALNDQTIPFSQQMQMAQLGLQGTGQASNLASTLATLLSANAQGAGSAAGAGTVGGSNALQSAISQILASLSSGNIVNRVLPQG